MSQAASPEKSPSGLTVDEVAGFRRRILKWYSVHQRDLPWRRNDDPYSVWISEMLLQQTRVDQARPYYDRFMARFPTVQALAEASIDEVLKSWEGLGYYARARNAHRAAIRIVSEYGGRIPSDPIEIGGLPGIGPYTAAAILSIAYNKDHAAVDGNVIRVLSRLFRIEDLVSRTPVKRRLQWLADTLLVPGRAADFNQAMMELGATVCLPRNPVCEFCPVMRYCKAQALLSDPSILPKKAPRKERPHRDVLAGLVVNDDRILIVQRPMDGLLGGLWEFPGGNREGEESLVDGVVRSVLGTTGLAISIVQDLPQVSHAFTHFRITLHGFICHLTSDSLDAQTSDNYRWVPFDQLTKFAFSRAHSRLIDFLRSDKHTGLRDRFVSVSPQTP